jgi:anaphase-promoting complex subunit 2
MTASSWHRRKQNVFRSVFHSDISQPTPYSTPSVRFTPQGQTFGGPLAAGAQYLTTPQPALGIPNVTSSPLNRPASGNVEDQVRWDRAWHAVTARIHLPPSVAAEDSFGALIPESQDVDGDFYDALRLVLRPSKHLPRASHTDDILQWHTQQVRHHFVQHVLPLLSACGGYGDAHQVLLASVRTLEAAHRQYLYGLSLLVRGMDEEESDAALNKFQRDLHAIIGNSMSESLLDSLQAVLNRLARVILGMDGSVPRTASSQDDQEIAAARQDLLQLVEALGKVGLAGERFQVLFAELMDSIMIEFVNTSYAGVWAPSPSAGKEVQRSAAALLPRAAKATPSSSRCINDLCEWVENHYSRLVVEIFARLGNGQVAWADVEKWKEVAVGRLAALRIHELIDIVLNWPESRGGLDDLRTSVTTPQRRLQLTDAFSAALQKRLLHPGRSTVEILQVYISMIRTFHALDHSKVLLDRVVHSLQLYLLQREDAVRVVVTGLLSNPNDAKTEAGKGKLVELAVLLNDPSQRRQHAEDEDLDWNDMEWLPDPVDAGVNYKRPKSEDVIGTLINALGSPEIFIKEFQNIIAERLLSTQAEFPQETKVLNILKKRFGEGALQNCDVMIKDIQDSKRVDSIISRNIRPTVAATVTPDRSRRDGPTYHSKILSRLFWPRLPKNPFVVPRPVAEIQEQYERGYEQLKSSRKLTWLDHLGTAKVQLELEDRKLDLTCKTYEAAVIYAFQEEPTGGSKESPLHRSLAELEEMLQIDTDLLEPALKFWMDKRVLRRTEAETFAVIERLDHDGQTGSGEHQASQKAGEDAGDLSPKKATNRGAMNAQENERRQIYWQFIVGMLTNSAPTLPLSQMAMMMKMLVQGGFHWSNEELQEFLGEKVADGELELAGGKYRLPPKK